MNKKQRKQFMKIIISIAAFVMAFVAEYLIEQYAALEKLTQGFVILALYLVPYLYIGGSVLKKAGKNICNGHVFDENFLMCLATIGAFLLGDYREAFAVMIFYQVGQLFENIAVNKSRDAITSLVNIRPDYANIEKDGELEKTDPYDVKIGDTIVVLPGEKIPLDGILIEGESFVNTAALTGESVPRKVCVGDTVLSGCINEQGVLKIEVQKEFDDSTVSKILEMVENASSRKSKSESFITRFAKFYTPIVVLLAVVVAIFPPIILKQSFAKWVSRALIFLVISCPCALVISVPLGFFGGIGSASKLGILVKGSNYLEAIAKAKTIVFDKTGTLTEGVFNIKEIKPVTNVTEDNILKLAAYAEAFSNHPIAMSIQRSFSEKDEKIDKENIANVEEIAGKGICLELNDVSSLGLSNAFSDNKYLVGNAKLLEANNIVVPEIMDKTGTVVFVADSKQCFGYIIISDLVKKEASRAISDLYNIGIKETIMLTGDRKATALAVADELGINNVYSELLPADKLKALEEIINQKKESYDESVVAYVGDGINDAPSLVRADIGIAMGAMGQDAAIEAADLVLMDDNPEKIATAKRIGVKTLSIVKQNIFFALGIKLIAMVLGVLGIANMWFAVFADVGVSVIAILNSMRMLRYKE